MRMSDWSSDVCSSDLRKLVVASSDGRGFMVPEDEVVAQTRAGKQVLNVKGDVEAAACKRVEGDSVAVLGSNRKLLVFPVMELPELTRGRGVEVQRSEELRVGKGGVSRGTLRGF